MGAQARADQQIDAGSAPVVNVSLGTGKLTVQTWDQPGVLVQSTGNVTVEQRGAGAPPKEIPIYSETVNSGHGQVTLPSEIFALPALSGSHQAVLARGNGDTTIMVPRGTAMITAHVDQGQVNVNDYSGVFVASVHKGGVALSHVEGTGFVQALDGPIEASNSTFTRLRARTATGDMTFRDVTSHQIQANSQFGAINYQGHFQPGLAHFESVHGNVAIGARGDAQINGSGRGPVVTATSQKGAVYHYKGGTMYDASGIPHFTPRPVEGAASAERGIPAQRSAPGERGVPAYAAPPRAAPGHQPQFFYPPRRYQPPAQQAPPRGYPGQGAQRAQQQGQGDGRRQKRQQPPY